MNEYVILVIGVVLLLIILIVLLRTCSKFRKIAYKLFLEAETEAKKGEKMDYVIGKIKKCLPHYIKYINDEMLRRILQNMFEVIKDFLNDGKINKNAENQ